jgi:hypothetical protein
MAAAGPGEAADGCDVLVIGYSALRVSPDAWMIPLFGESEADGKRDVLEGRLIWVALEK